MILSLFLCAAMCTLLGLDSSYGLRINGVLVPRRTREAVMRNIVFPTSDEQPNEAENELIPANTDLLTRINEMDSNERKKLFQSLMGNSSSSDAFKEIGVDLDTIQRKGEKPTAAGCKPEMTIVPLRQTRDRSLLTWPKCTHVQRCGGGAGGCCNSELHSCQAVETRVRYFEVDMGVLRGGKLMLAPKKQIVPIVEDVRCACSCTIKPEDCTDKQEYVKNDCYCRCMNHKERLNCPAEKIWDATTCSCACRDVTDCSTGEYFDYETCRCRIEFVSRFGGLFSNQTDNRVGIASNRRRINNNRSNVLENNHFNGFQ